MPVYTQKRHQTILNRGVGIRFPTITFKLTEMFSDLGNAEMSSDDFHSNQTSQGSEEKKNNWVKGLPFVISRRERVYQMRIGIGPAHPRYTYMYTPTQINVTETNGIGYDPTP